MPQVNPLQTATSQGTALRKVNPDGTITVVCRICGKPLYRGQYQGFSTAKCSDCAGTPTDGVVTGAVVLPDGRVVYQALEANDAVLFPETPEAEKMGLARAVFRALGFEKARPPKPPSEKSREVVRERKRGPLFGPGDLPDE